RWGMAAPERMWNSWRALGAVLVLFSIAHLPAHGSPNNNATSEPLEQLNRSLQHFVQKVTPAIVQIEVVGYSPDDDGKSDSRVLAKTESVGSGVILDSDGYVITNAHVVERARRIRVILDENARVFSSTGGRSEPTFEARMVGVFDEVDLA